MKRHKKVQSIQYLSMTSTLKINDKVKIKFDMLKAKIFLQTGKKMSQQELLELLLIQAEKSEKEIMDSISNSQFPLSDKQRKMILSLQFDLGFDTSKIDEDSIIYGD